MIKLNLLQGERTADIIQATQKHVHTHDVCS